MFHPCVSRYEDKKSILTNYRAYANKQSINFKGPDIDYVLSYDEYYNRTIDIWNLYKDLSNKLIWNLLLNAFPNKHPLEIVEAVYDTNTNFEAVQKLKGNN